MEETEVGTWQGKDEDVVSVFTRIICWATGKKKCRHKSTVRQTTVTGRKASLDRMKLNNRLCLFEVSPYQLFSHLPGPKSFLPQSSLMLFLSLEFSSPSIPVLELNLSITSLWTFPWNPWLWKSLPVLG